MTVTLAAIPTGPSDLPIELSFADAVAMIDAALELPEQTKRHWKTSLRRIADALDRPLASVPARSYVLSPLLARLHPVPTGMNPKTLLNHKSNVRRVADWLARSDGIPKRGAPLVPAWEELRASLRPGIPRSMFSLLMRFCSGRGIAPAAVDETVIDRYVAYRAQVGKAADVAYRRGLARAWNSNVGKVQGWPAHLLLVPAAREVGRPAWDEFPDGLKRDVDRYLETLRRVRRTAGGRRARPLKPSTIRQRRAELEALARTAIKTGVALENLDSLSALLAPAVVEKVLEVYWQPDENPKVYVVDLAGKLLGIARETKCLDQAACERLDEIQHELKAHRRGGITDKNTALIRQVLTPGVWSRVVNLPGEIMVAARSDRVRAPLKAAVTAQLAVAIAILTIAPVRLANLTTIKLGFNLIKPDGPDSNYWLVFPDYDVKNRVKLEFPLEQYLTCLIDEYVHDFRPALLRGSNGDSLFPGQCNGAKQKAKLSTQITRRIVKATGLRMTAHQFRHAAAAIILQSRPGEYELARRILGHRNVQTTINSYVGLENIQASKIFSKMVVEMMENKLEAAE